MKSALTLRQTQLVMLMGLSLLLPACTNVPRGSTERNDFSKMKTAAVNITSKTGKTTYTVYVADTDDTRAHGLMNVTETDLPADHGMLFIFPRDQLLSFWMRNTIIPLDIAYIRSDGVIVKTHTMTPLDETGYPSVEAARFALEVRAGQFQQHGIAAGDKVDIPQDLHKLGS